MSRSEVQRFVEHFFLWGGGEDLFPKPLSNMLQDFQSCIRKWRRSRYAAVLLRKLKIFRYVHNVIRFVCTDKKEKEIFLIYREIQIGAVAKSYIRKGFLIYAEIHKYFTMRRLLVIYDFAIDPF